MLIIPTLNGENKFQGFPSGTNYNEFWETTYGYNSKSCYQKILDLSNGC